ncbi:MAG: hypothetical protein Kow00129_04190 [Thermoleophilia bacterium]
MSGVSAEQTMGVFYKARVEDVMSAAAVTTDPDASAREMALLMRENQLGALVVVEEDEQPIGIVTERDLVYKVLADGEFDLCARNIMSSPPITISPEDHLYQAMYLMMRHRVRRLVVVDSLGRLAGFLSIRDLVRLEGYEGQVITNRIGKAADVESLCDTRSDIDTFIRKLYLGDVDGRSLCELLTDYNDALTRRIIALVQQRLRSEMRRPAVGFAWVCFGSEGRREQVLRGDQDNGIIIADDADEEALAYYRRMAAEANEDLDRCGFDLCQGGVMAREDKYFGTLSEWKERVYRMIHGLEDGTLLRDLTIFLDLRRVDGDRTLVDQLWDYALTELESSPFAVRALADDAVAKPVPINFLGRLQYEKSPAGKKGINIKRYGLLPLIAAVKVLAVDEGIRLTATAERIRALQEAQALEKDTAEELILADELLLKLKVQESLKEVFHGQSDQYFVFPEEWTEWERQSLKRAFKAIDHLEGVLRFRFHL